MAEVEEEEHKNFSGTGVYNFIQDLIVEGKDARFVNDNGCYAINWLTAPMRYHADFKARKDDIASSKASNNLRSALLNSYEKEGAKEYTEGQKRNAQGKISERQFQMPPRIFALLFNGSSDVLHSDDSSENEIGSIASQAGKSPQEAQDSSDTGFDEAMDLSCDDFSNTTVLDNDFPIITSLLDNNKNEEIYCDASRITTSSQIPFGVCEDESGEPLDDEKGVVESMRPTAGSIEGGQPFSITLNERLLEDGTLEKHVAHFDGVGVVNLKKSAPSTLSGRTPAAVKPGRVKVRVMTSAGRLLGIMPFLYVDRKTLEVLMQLHVDPDLWSLYEYWGIENHGTFGKDINTVQILDPFDPFTMQDQAVAEDETDFKSDQSEDGDNQSDYFADVETSSCGSSEVDAGWSDSDIYDGLCSKDGTPKRKLSENSNSSLEDTSFEVPDEVKTQLDKDLENKNDDENYEEPSGIVNFQPSWNVGWRRNDWAPTTTSRQQGVYVDETQEKQALELRFADTEIELVNKTSKGTSSREEEEKAYTSQEVTARPKETRTNDGGSENESWGKTTFTSFYEIDLENVLEGIEHGPWYVVDPGLLFKGKYRTSRGDYDRLHFFKEKIVMRISELRKEMEEMKRDLETYTEDKQLTFLAAKTIWERKALLRATEITFRRLRELRWKIKKMKITSRRMRELRWKIKKMKALLAFVEQELLEIPARKLKKMAEQRELMDVTKELARETKRYAKLPGQLKNIDNEAAQQMAGEAYQEEERRGSEELGLSLQEENQEHHEEFETLIARAEEWFLDLEAESQKLIDKVIMINGELCTQIETLLKGEMEASTKEMNETHTEEVDENLQVTPTSSDTGFAESMDNSNDLSAEPSSHYAVGDLTADDSEIATSCQLEMLITRREEWLLELKLETQKLLEEVTMTIGELYSVMKALFSDEMKESSTEMEEAHTDEVIALLQKMDVLLNKMEKIKLSGDEQAFHATEKEEEEERVKIFKELPQL